MATHLASKTHMRYTLGLTTLALALASALVAPAAMAAPALALPLGDASEADASGCEPLTAPTIIPGTPVLRAPVCVGVGDPGDPNEPLDYIICGPWGNGTGCCWVTGTWYDPSTWSAGCAML